MTVKELGEIPNKVLVPNRVTGDDHFWESVWFTLVGTCGAVNSDLARMSFVAHMQDGCQEYRFQGALGFGGKLYNSFDRLVVDYYPEDRTPGRDARKRASNKLLEQLVESQAP